MRQLGAGKIITFFFFNCSQRYLEIKRGEVAGQDSMELNFGKSSGTDAERE